jgi:murein DD-endopeptidase MepM/ murein hydrolase activator NlpD
MNIIDGIQVIRKRKSFQDHSILVEAGRISQIGIVMSIAETIEHQDTVKTKQELTKAFNKLNNIAYRVNKNQQVDLEAETEEQNDLFTKIGELVRDGIWKGIKRVVSTVASFVFKAIRYVLIPVFSIVSRIVVSAVTLGARLAMRLLLSPPALAIAGLAGLGYFLYKRYWSEPEVEEYEEPPSISPIIPKETKPVIPFVPLETKPSVSVTAPEKRFTPSAPAPTPGIQPRRSRYEQAIIESGLAHAIVKGESAYDYNAANKVKGGLQNLSGKYELTNMSVAEVMALQKEHKIFAVGKYQVVPDTLKDAIKSLGIDPKTKFDAATQDHIFASYLLSTKRSAVREYITGEVSDTKQHLIDAGVALAKEWRALADPRTNLTYGGKSDKNNKASVSWEEVRAALIKARSLYTGGRKKVSEADTEEAPIAVATGPDMFVPASGTLTSPYGKRKIFGKEELHPGVDIAGPVGTPIYAAQSGEVIKAGAAGSYGNLVQLDHGSGLTTLYGHNSKLLVAAGDKVVKGQQIAAMGSTGLSTGSHVHFEIRSGDKAIDPVIYVPKLETKGTQVAAGSQSPSTASTAIAQNNADNEILNRGQNRIIGLRG